MRAPWGGGGALIGVEESLSLHELNTRKYFSVILLMGHKGRAKKGLNVIQGIEGAVFCFGYNPIFRGELGRI